jgi:hypothetical protein
VVVAGHRAAGGAGVRSQLRLGQPGAVDPRLAGRGAGVGDRLFPVSLPAGGRDLRRLDPAIEDVSESLGLKPWAVFFRVVLPQLRLAICGGALLVGLHLLAEYGLYAMIRFDTFTTAIFDQFKSTFNGPAANMLAGVGPVLPGDAHR